MGSVDSSELDASSAATLLDAVGAHLDVARVPASIVAGGGAALALRGWVPRSGTPDCPMRSTRTWSGACSAAFAQLVDSVVTWVADKS